MDWKPEEENIIRRYLLNDATPEEQRLVEERLLEDDDYGGVLMLIESELTDDYANGALSERERRSFERNFLLTPQRRESLAVAREALKYAASSAVSGDEVATEERPSDDAGRRQPATVSEQERNWLRLLFHPGWKIAAYSALTLAIAIGVWRLSPGESEVRRGMAAFNKAYREQRPLEARISGLEYAPYIVQLGNDPDGVSRRDRDDAEFFLRRAAGNPDDVEALHALGQLYLAKRDYDEAIKLFEAALKHSASDASLHNDLGVALMERAEDNRSGAAPPGALESLAKGIESFSRALELDASFQPALFNRALCYERMAARRSAAADWEQYRRLDPHSKWADEARRRLERLREEQNDRGTQDRRQLLRDYLQACETGDDERAWEALSRGKELVSGQHLVWQLLREVLDEEGRESSRYLQALVYAGRLERQRTNDLFVADLSDFYLKLKPRDKAALRRAQDLLARGHAACIESNFDLALSFYTASGELFEQAGDEPEAYVASYLMSYCLTRSPDLQRGLRLAGEVIMQSESKGYKWLTAQALNAQAGVQGVLNEPSKVIESYEEALRISEEIGDHYNIQRNATALAYHYKNIANYQSALFYLERTLQQSQIVWPGERQMWRTYDAATRIFTLLGWHATAIAYGREALQQSLSERPDPTFVYLSYTHLGLIYAKLRHYAEALQHTRLGYEMAKQIPGPGGDGASAYAALQLSHTYKQIGDFESAVKCYDEAITYNARLGYLSDLYEAQKGKLLCYLGLGDDRRAGEQLKLVLDLAEQYRLKLKEDSNRNAFFDLEQNVYDLAIEFAYYKLGEREQAFAYSELSKARSLLDLLQTKTEVKAKAGRFAPIFPFVTQPYSLTDVQRRIPEGFQLVQFAVLRDKVLIWVVSRTNFLVAETTVGIDELRQLVESFLKEIRAHKESPSGEELKGPARRLYNLLIEPVKRSLIKAGQICIIPDKFLYHLPFNALVAADSGRFLLEEYQLSFAPSSSVFLICTGLAHDKPAPVEEKVLAVGDPQFDRTRLGLRPDASLRETLRGARRVAAFYPNRVVLTGADAIEEVAREEMQEAEVIHLASHYIIEPQDPLRSGLLLTKPSTNTPNDSTDGVLSARDVYEMKLPRARLVVLSACQTGGDRYYQGEGMIGISRAFVGAGVPLVVASLWPVDSTATADLGINFHWYRKRGRELTSAALRRAQLDMLRNQNPVFRHPYYWAAFICIGGQAGF